MTLLNNPNFIGFDGTPITGRTPTQTIVMSDGERIEMSPQLRAEVAHAYKLFCDAVNVSAFPMGYHVRNFKFRDGSKCRMESNKGVHKVMVWPVGGGEEVQQIWGVGICIVSDWSDSLFDNYKIETEYGWRPQPLILTPGSVLNPETEKYESTGSWKVTKVKQLLGGNKLWVSGTKKHWISWFSQNNLQDPVLYTDDTAIYQTLPNARLSERPVTNWTPLTLLNYYYDFSTGKNEVLSSRYIFRGNDTYRLFKYSNIGSHGFVCVHSTGKKLYNLYAVNNYTLELYSGKAKAKTGLNKPSASLTGNDVSTLEYTFTPPPGFYFVRHSIDVSRDGKKGVCLLHGEGSEANEIYDTYAEFSFDPSYGATYLLSGLTENKVPNNVTYVGGATSTITNDSSFRLYDNEIQVSCANVPLSMLPDFLPVVEGRKGKVSTYSSTDRDYRRTQNVSWLERVTFNENGEKVFDWTEVTNDNRYSGYETSNRVQVPNPNAGFAANSQITTNPVFTYTGDIHATWLQTREEVLHLGGSTQFKKQVLNYNLTEVGAATASYGTDLIMRYDKSVNASGTFSYEERTLVFYDPKFELIVYVERVISYTSLTCSGSSSYVSPPTSYSLNLTFPPATVNQPDTNTLALVMKLGGAEVFSLNIGAEAVTPIWYTSLSSYDASKYHPYEGTNGFKYNPSIPPVGVTTDGLDIYTRTDTAKTYTYSGWTSEECPGGSYHGFHLIPQEQTYNYSDIGVTATLYAADDDRTEVFCPLQISRTARNPERYMHVQYARDPITLSLVVNLSFERTAYDGGENKSWIWLVDDTGLKTLGDVLDLPENAEPRIWRDGSLNSLVSI